MAYDKSNPDKGGVFNFIKKAVGNEEVRQNNPDASENRPTEKTDDGLLTPEQVEKITLNFEALISSILEDGEVKAHEIQGFMTEARIPPANYTTVERVLNRLNDQTKARGIKMLEPELMAEVIGDLKGVVRGGGGGEEGLAVLNQVAQHLRKSGATR